MFHLYILIASSEELPSNMYKLCSFRSSCAFAKHHPGLSSSFIHSVVYNNSVTGQWRPWSDCADAQADLGLRWPYMPEDIFSHGVAQIRDVIFIRSGVKAMSKKPDSGKESQLLRITLAQRARLTTVLPATGNWQIKRVMSVASEIPRLITN